MDAAPVPSLQGTDFDKASRTSEDSKLKAPLYNERCPVFEDDPALKEAERKLSADVAERTLLLIDDVLQSLEDAASEQKRPAGLAAAGSFGKVKELYVRVFWLLLWCAAGVAISFVWIQDLNRALDCQARYQACLDQGGTAQTCPPILVIGQLERPLVDACRMATVIHVEGAALWRWLLVALLFWPLELVAYGVARVSAGISMMLIYTTWAQGSMLFTLVNLWRPLKYVVRAGLFLGIWFIIMDPAVQWAKQAQAWHEAGPATAKAFRWTTAFLPIHGVIWRLLLVFLLYTAVGFVRSALGKHLSIHTHHSHHFPKMQEALLHETIIRQLSKPACLTQHATVHLEGCKLLLRAYGPAHWAALQYVERLICHVGFWEHEHQDDSRTESIRDRAEQVRERLTSALCSQFQVVEKRTRKSNPVGFLRIRSVNARGAAQKPREYMVRRANSDSRLTTDAPRRSNNTGEPPFRSLTVSRLSPITAQDQDEKLSGRTELSQISGGARSEQRSPLPSTVFQSRAASPVQPDIMPDACSIHVLDPDADASATAPHQDQGHMRIPAPSFMSVPDFSQHKDDNSTAASRSGTDAMSVFASRKIRSVAMLTPWAAEETAAGEASAAGIASTSATLQVQAAVQQMLTYLTDNSYIKVFSLEDPEGDDEETEALRNRAHARQLGYWMFFNLRLTSVGVGLAEGDVRHAAQRARLDDDKAWALLSCGGVATATMEEVVSAMEAVYGQRKRLTRALANNRTVVREVETALGVVLMIVWVFLVAAIFDPGTVQVTWTALSAVFLSMSFIFGNAIRQVFENSIFLFQNSFYVGETISIEGTRYDVNSVTLLKVHLTRVDGADVTIPTSEMTRMRLHNITRSQPLWEGIHVPVDMETPVAALHCVAYHVIAAMKLHPKLFGGDYRVWFEGLVAGHKKEVVLWFNHAGPGADLLDYGLARTVLSAAIADGLAQAGATFTLPPVQGSGGPGGVKPGGLPPAQAWKHVAATEIVPTARSLASEGDVDQMTMAAAANNLILLS